MLWKIPFGLGLLRVVRSDQWATYFWLTHWNTHAHMKTNTQSLSQLHDYKDRKWKSMFKWWFAITLWGWHTGPVSGRVGTVRRKNKQNNHRKHPHHWNNHVSIPMRVFSSVQNESNVQLIIRTRKKPCLVCHRRSIRANPKSTQFEMLLNIASQTSLVGYIGSWECKRETKLIASKENDANS